MRKQLALPLRIGLASTVIDPHSWDNFPRPCVRCVKSLCRGVAGVQVFHIGLIIFIIICQFTQVPVRALFVTLAATDASQPISGA